MVIKWVPKQPDSATPGKTILVSCSIDKLDVAGHAMLSVRTSTTAAMLLLCALASGSGLPNSWFADEKVYTFAYNSRSLLAHSNLTTDAQVCVNVLMRWYKYFGCDSCFPTARIYVHWVAP